MGSREAAAGLSRGLISRWDDTLPQKALGWPLKALSGSQLVERVLYLGVMVRMLESVYCSFMKEQPLNVARAVEF
jgi:hypothetical protein